MENISSNVLKRNNLASIIYVIVILSVFPLVFHNYYFDILVFKYKFYYLATIIYIGFIIINNTIEKFFDKKSKYLLINIFKTMTIPEICIFIFMLIAIISTVQSDYLYESFWGNEGRFTGCFTLILYCTSTLIIIKYLHFKQWLLSLFLFSGFLVCSFGITDYFKLDILGFKVYMEPTQYNMFMSTIGNVNTYTSYVAIVMGVSTVMFTIEKTRWKMVLYFLCMICSFFAIIMGLSDNSYISLLTLFGFLPLYLFGTKTGIRRYLIVITSFLSVIYTIISINKAIPDKILEMQGIINHLPINKIKILLLFMICVTAIAYVYKFWQKRGNNNLGIIWKYIWLMLLILVMGVLLFIIYDINIALKSDRYGSLSQYLLFNDDWGTHRGFNWRIGLNNYNRFPFLHKIFGYGPDTYGILTHFNDFNEMTDKYNEIYDSAHNEYLQYFITMGPLSLISYLLFLASSIKCLILKSRKDVYAISIMFGVLCYSVQAFVNISVPIVTPIVFVLLATGLAKNKWI